MAPFVPQDFKDLISSVTSSLCSNMVNTLLRLPVLLAQLVAYIFDSDGNLTTEFQKVISDLTLRPGDLIFSAALEDTDGRLICNGAVVSRSTYANLFLAIGELYGAGDGTTTFGLPDFRDRFPIGQSGTKSTGTSGGSATATLVTTNLPPHAHDALSITEGGAGGSGEFLFQSNSVTDRETETDSTLQTEMAGGTGSPAAAVPFTIVNPYVACFVYIKV